MHEEDNNDPEKSMMANSENDSWQIEKMRLTEGSEDDEETTCGYWFLKGPLCQKFARRWVYVSLFGLLGCLYGATSTYFNGIISTVEKQFGIPSQLSGIIMCGNDISQVLISVFLTYYVSRNNKPRWIGFGGYTVVLFCLMSALPMLIYGPGADSYSLTKEMAEKNFSTSRSSLSEILEERKMLCQDKPRKCTPTGYDPVPAIIFFLAQFVSGIGQTLFHSVGFSYLDDNVKRSTVPIMLSISYFLRSLGPVAGYALSFICLKIYVVPHLTPTIATDDPRWLGAWWLGWLVLSVIILVVSTLITLFPERLPQTPTDKKLAEIKANNTMVQESSKSEPSFKDMIKTFKRLFKNKPLMFNIISTVFYTFGLLPFHIFLTKYLEIVYAKSASFSSLMTGVVLLASSAIGLFASGIILSKYKPKARYLASWSVFTGIIIMIGIISFAFLSCPDLIKVKNIYSDNSQEVNCTNDCHCENIKYTPVCSADGTTRFISPCHAGCRNFDESKKIYRNCSCITNAAKLNGVNSEPGIGLPGLCKVNCQLSFLIFLGILSVLLLIGSSARITNFLINIRSVDEADKIVSMGLGLCIISLGSFIPSPIVFGYIFDSCCLYWGSACSGKRYCWIYDTKKLKNRMSFTSGAFISIGVIFDIFVWHYVKDTQIFNEEIKSDNESKPTKLQQTHNKG